MNEKAFGGSVEITLPDGTVITDQIAVADARPLGARPFAREQYVHKCRTLAAGLAKDRAKALVDAGADAIFPEAMRDLAEFKAIHEAVDVPIQANMTEFGKSDLFTREQLQSVPRGLNMVIYPVTLLRSAMGAAERVLGRLAVWFEEMTKPLSMLHGRVVSSSSSRMCL